MIDYTNKRAGVYHQQSQNKTEAELKTASKIAEDDYRRKFGPRPVNVHVQSRRADRDTPGFGIAPKRLFYILQFPQNYTVFATVMPDEDVIWDGWLWHHEIAADMVPAKDPGTHILNTKLRDMKSLPTRRT